MSVFQSKSKTTQQTTAKKTLQKFSSESPFQESTKSPLNTENVQEGSLVDQSMDGYQVNNSQLQTVSYTTLRELAKLPPEQITDELIHQSREYQAYMNANNRWQWQLEVTTDEALLACKNMIINIQALHQQINWGEEAEKYVLDARKTLSNQQKEVTVKKESSKTLPKKGKPLKGSGFEWLLQGGVPGGGMIIDFPSEIGNNNPVEAFLKRLGNISRTNLKAELNIELHWRLIQVAAAIWENDGLGNVLRLIEGGIAPSWESGKTALEQLYRNEEKDFIQKRREIQKNDAAKMSAMLLYEFSSGRIAHPDKWNKNRDIQKAQTTRFSENDAFTKELNQDNVIVKEALTKFYTRMENEGFQDECDFIKSKSDKRIDVGYSFSPDHTSLKESWQKHKQAWLENPFLFVIGGMAGYVQTDGNTLTMTNTMGRKSLGTHILEDNNANYPNVLRSTYQEFVFKFTQKEMRKFKP